MPRSRPLPSTPPANRWAFLPRFRRNAFGWKSEPAITRTKEAVTEIKAAARKDPRHGAAGAVLFLERVAPALDQVDGSSGAMGTAVRKAVATLVSLIATAEVEDAVREAWLERLMTAYLEDDRPWIEALGEHWGPLCVNPHLASLWADRLLETVRWVLDVARLEKGHLRLQTAFKYPDGSHIDIFLADEGPLIPPRRLTDFGNTSSWLLDLQVKPWLSSKRRQLLDQALSGLGVQLNGGALDVDLSGMDGLVDGVVRLGSACIRMADLHYTRRSSLSVPMGEALEDLFNDSECTYEADVEFMGRL